LVDGFGGFKSIGVLGCSLEPNLNYIEWLTWLVLAGWLMDNFDTLFKPGYFVIHAHF
jgi:hypothetical protein